MPSPVRDEDYDDGFDYPDDGGGGGDYGGDDDSPPPPPPVALPLPFSFPKPVPIMLPKPVPTTTRPDPFTGGSSQPNPAVFGHSQFSGNSRFVSEF